MGASVDMACDRNGHLRNLRPNPQLPTGRSVRACRPSREGKQLLKGGAGLMDGCLYKE